MNYQLTCDTAYNGADAVRMVQGGTHYEIIFMDINMPIMDGFEASRLISQHFKESGKKGTPIIALTGYSNDSIVKKCKDCGMESYMNKPITQDELRTVMRKYIV